MSTEITIASPAQSSTARQARNLSFALAVIAVAGSVLAFAAVRRPLVQTELAA